MTKHAGFPHQRLDAFRIAMELAIGVERLAAGLPRGHADLKDQVRRAASATMRNISEGANRWSARDKAARFVIARRAAARGRNAGAKVPRSHPRRLVFRILEERMAKRHRASSVPT